MAEKEQKPVEMSDEKLELQLRMEREYYQNDYKEAVETIVMKYKLPRERVEAIADKVYERDNKSES